MLYTEKIHVRSHTHARVRAHVHTVWCIPPHGLPGTPVPCAVSAPARAPWGQPGLWRASAGHCGWAALFWAWLLAPCPPISASLWVSGSWEGGVHRLSCSSLAAWGQGGEGWANLES